MLTSYETTTSDPTNLDQEFGSDYCFTGLKVTIVPDTEEAPHRPTSTQLIPILHTTINNAVESANNGPALVRNQYARIPEITHGQLEGEAEVTKLNVLQNITLDAADAKDLLVEEQLIVGTSRNTNADILKVTLDCDDSGSPQNPYIEVNSAPVTIDNVPEGKAPITVNVNSTPALIKASSSDSEATVLSVEGSAEVSKNLTVTNRATARELSVASDNFEVDSNGGTTIKNNLTVKKNDAPMFSVDAANGDTTVAGALTVAAGTALNSTLNIAGTLVVNADKFKVDAEKGDTAVAGALDVTSNLKVNNNFEVNAADGNTTIAGTLDVGPSSDPYLTVTEDTTTIKSIAVTNDTESDTSTSGALVVTGGVGIGGSLNVKGSLSAGNIVSKKPSGKTSITGELTVVQKSSDQPKFSVTDTTTTITTSATDIGGNLNINTNKFTVEATSGNATIAGTLDVANNTTIKQNLIVMNGANEKFKVEADTGKATINGVLEVTGTSASLGNGAVQINADQVIINKATQISKMLRADGGLRVIDESTFDVDTSGNLTAMSVTTGTLNVPNHDGNGYASFSLGSKVENDDGMVTRSLYFQDEDSSESEEYVLTPTVAKAALLDMIYPAGSIYMTLENLVSTHSLSPITKTINKKCKTGYAIFDPSNTTNPAGGL